MLPLERNSKLNFYRDVPARRRSIYWPNLRPFACSGGIPSTFLQSNFHFWDFLQFYPDISMCTKTCCNLLMKLHTVKNIKEISDIKSNFRRHQETSPEPVDGLKLGQTIDSLSVGMSRWNLNSIKIVFWWQIMDYPSLGSHNGQS